MRTELATSPHPVPLPMGEGTVLHRSDNYAAQET